MKKKLISTILATSLLTLSGLFAASSASAVSYNACNQGTANAAHGNGGIIFKDARAYGIYKIGYQCHND